MAELSSLSLVLQDILLSSVPDMGVFCLATYPSARRQHTLRQSGCCKRKYYLETPFADQGEDLCVAFLQEQVKYQAKPVRKGSHRTSQAPS